MLIRQRYELLETLGAGGEARVVKALDRQHGRFVALKIRRVRDGRGREELLNEARVLLALSPHQALPLVREDFFDGDDYVVAMDWVDGTDLATLLRERGRPGLAPSSVLEYLAQAAEALTHLHAHDPPVIHGDVKPGNLILTRGGRVKLVDFGMSSAPNAARRRTGTQGYRAPELVTNGTPSRASDIYALAATAFALLAGSAPAGVLPPWEGIDPAQSQQLEKAIRAGMATDPSRRPPTPGELVERLRVGWAEALPTGVVTFCLSDIEGSTAMWDADPVAMAAALVRHDEVIADCAQAHGGRLLKAMGEGDSTVCVFDSAPSALQAALAATRALSTEPWPGGLHVVARFGLHTGEAERRGADYRGPSVNFAARLRAQADGGQIFLSSVTAELVAEHLPEGCSLVDLGPHRLRGLRAPESIHALKGHGVSTPLSVTECPYRGLLAFEPEDRDYFFGRETVVKELLGRLGPGRLLAVVGASGSGKSSVLRAGVVAAVRCGEVPGIERARLLTPGSSPCLAVEDDPAGLIVVDQFEELFTVCDDQARRQAFIDALMATGCPVAIGVRADMYGKLGGHPELARAVAANHVLLGAMTEAELARAVKEPARLAGLRLEPGLVELVVREVADEPGALPLLSHALRATWERRDGRTLTVEGYRESGGVGAAIANTADSVVGSLPPERRRMLRSMFLRLTELGEGVAETRRRVNIEELVPEGVPPAVVETLLERLSDARLVTLGEGTAQVAHEVLIREWPTLRGWLDEDREGIRLHRQLGDAARMWEAGGREASDLYRGTRLAAATEWASVHRRDLNATERSFIEASTAEADRGRRAQLRSNRRLRSLLAGTAALLLVAVLAGVVALIQRSHAQTQALTSDAERVGAQAVSEKNPDLAMLYAVAGVKLQNRLQTRGDLLATLQNNPELIRLLRPSRNEITSLAVDPTGRLLATGDSGGVVHFDNMSRRRSIGVPVRLPGVVLQKAMAFSPRGGELAVLTVQGVPQGFGGEPGTTNLFEIDPATHKVRRLGSWHSVIPLLPDPGGASLAYSPDGRHIALAIASVRRDGSLGTDPVRLLDASTGRTIWRRSYPLRPGQMSPRVSAGDVAVQLRFASDGMLVSSAQQGETLLWNARRGRIMRRFAIGGEPAVSANGAVAVAVNSASFDNASSRIAVIDLHTGRARFLRSAPSSVWVNSLMMTPNGKSIVGATIHGDTYIWDTASGSIAWTIAAPVGAIGVAALDPAGRTVLVGSRDGSVSAFDLSGARRLGRAFQWNVPKQSCPVNPCFVVNRQSDLMATDQGDGSIALIDLRTLRRTATLGARNGPFAPAIAFFPDGRTLLTGGVAGRITLWDTRSHRVLRTIEMGAPVTGAAVSPDGRMVAVQTQPQGSPRSFVQVLLAAGGKPIWRGPVQDGSGALSFSPDGREVAALGCCTALSTVGMWDARSGHQLFRRRLSTHATAIAFSPDSRVLAVGTQNGQVLFWSTRRGSDTTPPLHVASANVAAMSYSPNGAQLAASATDETTTLWNVHSRKQLGGSFPTRLETIPTPVFEPDGRLLIDYNADAAQWPMNVSAWERFACQVAGRELTRAEWHDVLPDRAYRPVCHG